MNRTGQSNGRKRAVLLSLAWVSAAVALYGITVLLDVYWNLGKWRFKADLISGGLVIGIVVVLAATRFLAEASRDGVSRVTGTVVCLGLLGVAAYALSAEPLTAGLFARDASSPLIYRAGRLLWMSLPAAWLALSLRQSRTQG